MRSFVLAGVLVLTACPVAQTNVLAQQIVSNQPNLSVTSSNVCPKCGKVHAAAAHPRRPLRRFRTTRCRIKPRWPRPHDSIPVEELPMF